MSTVDHRSDPRFLSPALQRAMARAAANRAKAGVVTDMERILALPLAHRDAAHWAMVWSKRLRRHRLAPVLRDVQGDALEALSRQPAPKGLAVLAGVGHGKTGIGALAGAVVKAQRVATLVPSDVLTQTNRDLEWWATHYKFPAPKVWSHDLLSRQDSLLEDYAPDLIVVDESHAFSKLTSARTIRLVRYVVANPSTRVVLMSGTFTSVSILDCSHLMELALRGGTPLPLDSGVAEVWGSVLDADGDPDSMAWRSLAPLVDWAVEESGPEILEDMVKAPRAAVRKAWNVRLRTAPGVVTTTESSCSSSLVIHPRRRPVDPLIQEALDHLRGTWCLPDGTELVLATQVAKAAKTLSLGFYHRWVWPDGQVDQEFMEERRAWAAVVRSWMEYHAMASKGLTSPGLLEAACKRGEGPRKVQEAWNRWAPYSDRPLPPTEAQWFSHMALEDVAEWVDRRDRGLVWFHHETVGLKLAEVLGLRVYGAGDGDAPDHETFPALQISVHRRGKNYQGERHRKTKGWGDNYVIEPPGGGKVWEQLIGRTHRAGQERHQVDVSVAAWTWPLRRALEHAIAEAEYAQHMTGNAQKLVLASWDLP